MLFGREPELNRVAIFFVLSILQSRFNAKWDFNVPNLQKKTKNTKKNRWRHEAEEYFYDSRF